MTITDYRNFDLLITRAGDRYRAFVVDAPEGEASVIFDAPFVAGELARLGGSGRRASRPAGKQAALVKRPTSPASADSSSRLSSGTRWGRCWPPA